MIVYTQEVFAQQTIRVSPKVFVKSHLREIRKYQRYDGTPEYCLYVSSKTTRGMLENILTITEDIGFDPSDFDVYGDGPNTPEHQAASEKLIALLERLYPEQSGPTDE